MPIDTSIYANLRPVAPIASLNPMDLISSAAKIQDIQAQVEQRRLAGEKARQDAQDQADIRTVMSAAPDVDTGIQTLYARNPRAAASLEEQVGKARKEKLEAARLGLVNKGLQADQALMLARTVDGDTGTGYALARPAIVATSPVLDPILPAVGAPWDPARWSQILQAGVSGKELLDAKQKALEFWGKGDVRNSLATMYSRVDPTSPTAPQAWAQIGQTARDMGAKQSEVDVFGPYDPGAPARAAKLGITPEKQAELAAKPATEEQDKARYRAIVQQAQLGQATSPADAAWKTAYEKEKLLATDTSASAAANRQAAAINAQVAQQSRAQDFTQLQTVRKEIDENVNKPYATAHAGAETLRDVVASARAGNKVAGALQNLETTMSAIKSQGLSRINTAEIGATGDAGSLWDHIQSYVGQKAEGQPVPANIQQDMLAFADILDKAAYKKAQESHAATNKTYGTNIPLSIQPPASAAPAGAGPDLSGLTAGHGRTFTTGPYAGQTWTMGPNGQPKRVS